MEKTESRVNFSKKSTSVPTVAVSLSSADISNKNHLRVKVYTNHVGWERFTVYEDSWSDIEIHICGVGNWTISL